MTGGDPERSAAGRDDDRADDERPPAARRPPVAGRYVLREQLAVGGMGAVWSARDSLMDRDVAVKEMHVVGRFTRDTTAARAAAVERVRREARAAGRVDHPSVVTIHDVVVHEGQPWIVMELVRGETLADLLEREGTLPEREAARLTLPVLEGLCAAHGRGVLHRDVKPANVLLGREGRVVLTDFGIARIEGETSLTVSGEFLGSLRYCAPERMGGRDPGPEGDLWSVGVLLYEAVEGWSPFQRGSMEATVAAVLAGVPEPLRHAERLAPLIYDLLAQNPDQRPSGDEALMRLRAVAGVAGAPETSAPPAPSASPRTSVPSQSPEVADGPAPYEPEGPDPYGRDDPRTDPARPWWRRPRLPYVRRLLQSSTRALSGLRGRLPGLAALSGLSALRILPGLRALRAVRRPSRRLLRAVGAASVAVAVCAVAGLWLLLWGPGGEGGTGGGGGGAGGDTKPGASAPGWRKHTRTYHEDDLGYSIAVPASFVRKKAQNRVTYVKRGEPEVWIEVYRDSDPARSLRTARDWARHEIEWLAAGGRDHGRRTARTQPGVLWDTRQGGHKAAAYSVRLQGLDREGRASDMVKQRNLVIRDGSGEVLQLRVSVPRSKDAKLGGEGLYEAARAHFG